MGNKVKGVVSSSPSKTMTFSYIGQLDFGYSKDYVPPYVHPQGAPPLGQDLITEVPVVPPAPPMAKSSIADSDDPVKHRQFETEKERRRRSAEIRAKYRTALDTVREVRSWKNSLGI